MSEKKWLPNFHFWMNFHVFSYATKNVFFTQPNK